MRCLLPSSQGMPRQRQDQGSRRLYLRNTGPRTCLALLAKSRTLPATRLRDPCQLPSSYPLRSLAVATRALNRTPCLRALAPAFVASHSNFSANGHLDRSTPSQKMTRAGSGSKPEPPEPPEPPERQRPTPRPRCGFKARPAKRRRPLIRERTFSPPRRMRRSVAAYPRARRPPPAPGPRLGALRAIVGSVERAVSTLWRCAFSQAVADG